MSHYAAYFINLESYGLPMNSEHCWFKDVMSFFFNPWVTYYFFTAFYLYHFSDLLI